MIKNKKLALIFRICALLLSTIGLVIHIGIFSGQINYITLMKYTTQSNFLAIILFTMLTIRTAKSMKNGTGISTRWYARFKMICAINLLVTFLVYWALIAPKSENALWTFENMLIHVITPLLCILEYIFYTKAKCLKYRDAYYSCLFPLCYVIYISIAGFLGFVYETSKDGNPVRFPYSFLDFDRIGNNAIIYIVCLLFFFILISHLIYIIDKKVRL